MDDGLCQAVGSLNAAGNTVRRGRIAIVMDAFTEPLLSRIFEGVTVLREEPSMSVAGQVDCLLEGPMFEALQPGEKIPAYLCVVQCTGTVKWKRLA